MGRRCSCGASIEGPATRCGPCHATYQKEWRRGRVLTPEQRLKARARRAARHAKVAGVIKWEPCACGSTKSEMHHEDYSKPLEVRWICRKCHMDIHYPAGERQGVRKMQTKLAEWMERNFHTNKMFAAKIAKKMKRKTFSDRTVESWRQGRTMPRYWALPIIASITDNEVTANDFVSRETK